MHSVWELSSKCIYSCTTAIVNLFGLCIIQCHLQGHVIQLGLVYYNITSIAKYTLKVSGTLIYTCVYVDRCIKTLQHQSSSPLSAQKPPGQTLEAGAGPPGGALPGTRQNQALSTCALPGPPKYQKGFGSKNDSRVVTGAYWRSSLALKTFIQDDLDTTLLRQCFTLRGHAYLTDLCVVEVKLPRSNQPKKEPLQHHPFAALTDKVIFATFTF